VDEDGQNVTYQLLSTATGPCVFSFDSLSGWISLNVPLDREAASQYYLRIFAINDGRGLFKNMLQIFHIGEISLTHINSLNFIRGLI